ncbi:GerAB/ArcD/ProY family transporter [Gottfriedia solisilvae]|uniref:Germination protein KB n=1 Tax=Gottfriedia solisilvae TaxID=1516104 RepID=A0A8J3EYD3_9BACI|nr:endospore germination permease [Gottfriedia solisilvae]GGI15905.1 germination protein KB [Gottfriedia solisilvae]
MITKKNSITKFQLFFFLIQSQVGIGLLSLPNVVQATAKGDGWISTILAGVIVQIMLIIYWFLFKQFPNENYSKITIRLFGKYIGKLLNFIIYLYFILTGSLALILYINCISLWLLPLTPLWVLSLFIILSSIYLALSELTIIARFFVIATFMLVLLILLSFLTYGLEKEFQNILPIGHSGMKNIMMGSNKSIISMLGFEGVLIVYPFIINKEKGLLKSVSLANLTVTALYTYFLFLCLISFSPMQLKQIREPVLYLFKALSYEMLDRIDLIFISSWIVPMTTSIIAYLFFASKSISKEKSYKKTVLVNAIIIFLISIYPFDENMITKFSTYVTYLSYFVVFILPILLLVLTLFIKTLKRSENA